MRSAELKRKVRLGWNLLFSRNFRKVWTAGNYDSYYMRHVSSCCSLDLDRYLRKSGNDFLAEGNLGEKGWMQLADPHPFFDTAYYLCRYFPTGLDENPYIHYLRYGWRQGLLPGPFLAERLASSTQSECPLLCHGGRSSELAGGWFDAALYLDTDPALEGVQAELVRHYKLYGGREGKSPCQLFEPDYYLRTLDREQRLRAETDPLSHYICSLVCGSRSALGSPSPFFDPYQHCERWGIAPTEKNIRTFLLGAETRAYAGKGFDQLAETPVVSLLVPVYNPRLNHLNNCIRSVLYQSYPHWQLCLVDDASQSPAVKERLLFWAERDSRIQVRFLQQNSGIAGATNAAAAMARGEFIAFLDNDDTLSLDCLARMVVAQQKTQAELLYTDEDLVGENGVRFSLFRKPDYTPRLLLDHNYITHCVMVRRSLFQQVGGFDSNYNGAQDYDLMLRLSEQTSQIHHLAEPLYHWRATASSTSINHDEKGYADENGRKALAAALLRRGISGCAVKSGLNFFYRIEPVGPPAASHVFLWQAEDAGKDVPDMTKRDWLQQVAQPGEEGVEVSCIVSSLCDRAAVLSRAACGVESAAEFFVFVELPFVTLAENWLGALQTAFFDREVGLVCGRRRFAGSDGPSFLLPDLGRHSTSFYAEFLASHSLHGNGMHCLQDLLCPGFGLVAVRKSLFCRIGGFREKYSLLAMADLALRLRQEGFGAVYTPAAWIDFAAEGPLIFEDSGREKQLFQREWHQELQRVRQYYNSVLLTDAGVEETAFSRWFFGEKEEVAVESRH